MLKRHEQFKKIHVWEIIGSQCNNPVSPFFSIREKTQLKFSTGIGGGRERGEGGWGGRLVREGGREEGRGERVGGREEGEGSEGGEG